MATATIENNPSLKIKVIEIGVCCFSSSCLHNYSWSNSIRQGVARGEITHGPALVGASVNEASQKGGCSVSKRHGLLLLQLTFLDLQSSIFNSTYLRWGGRSSVRDTHLFCSTSPKTLNGCLLECGFRVDHKLTSVWQGNVTDYEVFWADSCEERLGTEAANPGCARIFRFMTWEQRIQHVFPARPDSYLQCSNLQPHLQALGRVPKAESSEACCRPGCFKLLVDGLCWQRLQLGLVAWSQSQSYELNCNALAALAVQEGCILDASAWPAAWRSWASVGIPVPIFFWHVCLVHFFP